MDQVRGDLTPEKGRRIWIMVKESCQKTATEEAGGGSWGQDVELVGFLPCLILVRFILQTERNSAND